MIIEIMIMILLLRIVVIFTWPLTCTIQPCSDFLCVYFDLCSGCVDEYIHVAGGGF